MESENNITPTYLSNQTWNEIEKELETWPLMGYPHLTICVYLLLVLVIVPAYMRNRKPYDLKNAILIYNMLQVLFSVFLLYKALQVGCPIKDLISPVCHHRLNFNMKDQLFLMSNAWWFLCAKITELVETVFFVLRKKSNQISFLHVYHHTSTYLISWYVLRYAPEEYTIITMMINSTIHIIMYTYYTISALGPQYRKYIWWKKYITTIQIIQFLVFVVYLSMAKFSNCGYSNTAINFLIANMLFMTILFSNFYRSSYKKNV